MLGYSYAICNADNNQSGNAMPWHCIGLTLLYAFLR